LPTVTTEFGFALITALLARILGVTAALQVMLNIGLFAKYHAFTILMKSRKALGTP
jgi:hypothetical protein